MCMLVGRDGSNVEAQRRQSSTLYGKHPRKTDTNVSSGINVKGYRLTKQVKRLFDLYRMTRMIEVDSQDITVFLVHSRAMGQAATDQRYRQASHCSVVSKEWAMHRRHGIPR